MVEGGARNHDAFGDAGRSRGENHIGQTMTAAASLKLRRLDDFRWIKIVAFGATAASGPRSSPWPTMTFGSNRLAMRRSFSKGAATLSGV